MPSPITRGGGYANLLRKRFHRVVIADANNRQRELEYREFLNEEVSDENPHTDFKISGLGATRAMPDGTSFPTDSPVTGGTKDWETVPSALAFEVYYRFMRDEKYGVIDRMTKALSRSDFVGREQRSILPLDRAFNTAFVGFNAGEALCQSHALLESGATFSNAVSGNATFGVTGLQLAIQIFDNQVDERNLPAYTRPDQLVLGKAYRFIVDEVMATSRKPGSDLNDINVLTTYGIKALISHYLATDTFWFLLGMKGEHDLWRKVVEEGVVDVFDDPRTKNVVVTIWGDDVTSFGDWRNTAGSQGLAA